MIFKVVSGGQTGVDQAALQAAINQQITHGGWCPKGRIAENGVIPAEYILQETESSDYGERTRLNIRDSDGTLILVDKILEGINDGTILTLKEVKEKNKPHLIYDVSQDNKLDSVVKWIQDNDIRILNIAGPRESQSPGIYKLCLNVLENLYVLITKVD